MLASEPRACDDVLRPLEAVAFHPRAVGDVVFAGKPLVALGLVVGLPKLHVRKLQRVAVLELHAEVEEAAPVDGLAGGQLFVVHGLRTAAVHAGELVAAEVLAAVVPGVAVFAGGQKADRKPAVEVAPQAELAVAGDVGLQLLLGVDVPEVVEARAEAGALRPGRRLEIVAGEALDVRWHRPRAVVEAPVVFKAAAIGEALAAGGLGIAADVRLQREVVDVGRRPSADHHRAAAEIARQVRRVGLLHQQIAHDARGHDVEGHGLLERHRRGDARAVQERHRVPLA